MSCDDPSEYLRGCFVFMRRRIHGMSVQMKHGRTSGRETSDTWAGFMIISGLLAYHTCMSSDYLQFHHPVSHIISLIHNFVHCSDTPNIT